MICTAAGREGINLQHARVLFNFDLPWNPMDMEQRIGRIHRYGQRHTAQVYNLVLSDTIEGKIFLLLDEKLTQIAETLGKVDEQARSPKTCGPKFWAAVRAAELREAVCRGLERPGAEAHARGAGGGDVERVAGPAVVFELFQDLGGFNIDEYKSLSDTTAGMSGHWRSS